MTDARLSRMDQAADSSSSLSAGVSGTAKPDMESADEEVHELSVVVPVTERPEDLAEIYLEYSPQIARTAATFEFIFVLRSWDKERAAALEGLIATGAPIRVVQAPAGTGEAAMLKLAERHCRGRTVLTLPAYHRVTPESLGGLIAALGPDVDLVMARRWPRRDSWLNRLQNKVFHLLIGTAGQARVHDTGCGVRLMQRTTLREIPLYGDFSRFLPVLASQHGYTVEEVDCAQHARDVRTRLYSPVVYARRLIDLLGVFFLVRFTYKPLRFFGLLGSGLALPGLIILAVLFVQRLGGRGIAERPLLLLGLLLTNLGVQAVALGLIGEIIVHFQATGGSRYRLRKDVGE